MLASTRFDHFFLGPEDRMPLCPQGSKSDPNSMAEGQLFGAIVLLPGHMENYPHGVGFGRYEEDFGCSTCPTGMPFGKRNQLGIS